MAAETFADWFRPLAALVRLQILNLLASAGEPVTVGQIVEQVECGQFTMSAHLKIPRKPGSCCRTARNGD
ncbi:ArsR family transcriptional regulator [Amycolatopsis sp. NPDC089917]|uniref:ArsR/SmtB family transcription factor n=1 Tax=Amycolatopsis sp. NPDC089917 TaxID=3155187 RepID=UPI0034226CAF